MQKMSFRDLIDQDTLQRVQNEFCQVAGIAAYCVDGDHNRITMPSGDAKLLEWLLSESCADQVAAVLERVQEGSLEDQAVEELEDGTGHIASIAVRVGENTVIYWVVFESSTTENIHFYHPSPIFCTDNAAMIGAAAYYEYINGARAGWDLNAVPNLKLGER